MLDFCKGRADGCPLFLFFTGYAIIPRYLLVLIFGKRNSPGEGFVWKISIRDIVKKCGSVF